MKAIFEFDLPEQQNEYEQMSKAQDYHLALWDISTQLRSWQKYGHSFKSADDALEQIRTDFYRVINHFNINLDL